jgi:hypothetical protein
VPACRPMYCNSPFMELWGRCAEQYQDFLLARQTGDAADFIPALAQLAIVIARPAVCVDQCPAAVAGTAAAQ